MEKEKNIIQVEILCMKVILLMANLKDTGNVFLKLIISMLGSGKMVSGMEKELYIIQMEILNMKVILLMTKKKGMENIYLKMVIII